MRRWVVILGIVVLVVVAGFLTLSYCGGRFIRTRLQQAMGPGLTVGAITVYPTHLSVKGIQYEDPTLKKRMFQVDEIRIYPSVFSALRGAVQIQKCALIKPSFFLYRSRDGSFIGPFPTGEREKDGIDEKRQEHSAKGDQREARPAAFKIDRLQIQKGSLDLEDHKTEGSTAYLHLKDMDLEMKALQYPFPSVHSPVEFKGKFKGVTKEGSLTSNGWIDLQTTDMEMTLKTRDIEVKTFEPYYQKRVTAEISSGHVDLDAKIAIRKRLIDAPGEMELVDLRVKEGSGSVFYLPAKSLIRILRDRGNRIKVRFRVKGNLDDPQFDLRENIASRMGIALAQSLGLPVTVVGEEVVGGAARGAGGLMEGLKSVEDFLGKKKKPRE